MGTLSFHEVIFPFFALGTTLAGVVVFGSLAGHIRDARAYTGIFVMLSISSLGVIFDVAVLFVAGSEGSERIAFELNRIRELAISGFMFALPYGLSKILPVNRTETRLAALLWKIGLGAVAINVIIAFAAPSLFVSVTARMAESGASVFSVPFGRGETGIVFAIRDGLLGLFVLLSLAISIWGIVSRSVKGPNLLIVGGIVGTVSFGASAIYANFVGRYPGPLDGMPFSRVSAAITTFTLLAIGAYVLRYVAQTRSLDAANGELEKSRDRLGFLAYHNAGTGMPNKQSAMRDVDECISRHVRANGSPSEVYLCQLDSLGMIEDSYGSAASEHVLQTIGRRLKELFAHVTELEIGVYHVEGSNFMVLLRTILAQDARENVEAGLMSVTSSPISFDGQVIYPSARLGHYEFSQEVEDAEGVFRRVKRAIAGSAEHAARISRYSPAIHTSVGENQELIQRLRGAVDRDEFTLFYQPIMNRAGEIASVEALIRWDGADTQRFILLAEQSGLIVPITNYVARTVCGDMPRLREAFPGISVHMNISARHVHQMDLEKTLFSCMDTYDITPEAIGVEITETSFIYQSEAFVGVIRSLRHAGFGVAIDDFGTGYSSLSYLKQIPADKIKIDKSFVDTLPDSGDDRALVDATIVLAHELGKRIVAEGVETVAQRDYLLERGADYLQGYLFARPMPLPDLITLGTAPEELV